MAKMRVLHVHSGMCGGGIETFIATMADALASEWDSHLFSLVAARAYEGPQLPVQDAERVNVGVAGIGIRLLRHVRAWRPDIIHAHFPDAARYGAVVRAVACRQARLIVHWHNTHEMRSRTPVGAYLMRYALRQADAILACSRAAAEYHGPLWLIDPGAVRILYNPVDIAAFTGAIADSGLKGRVGAKNGEVLGIFFGRLSVQVKGLDVLCQAVRLLPDDLPFRLALVGPGDLPAVRDRLALPETATLTGPVDRAEVPGVLRACDICLQPSRSEGLGISIIEAMAAGLPVVATRVGGIPEAVEDGVTGILVPPEDPQALAEAIRWMVEHPAERAEMGRRGRERARLFDVRTIAGQLEAIYREVLNG